MSFPNISPDDEVLRAQDIGRLAKQSTRWGQKQLELGTIPSFLRGRERVTLKSWWLAYLQQLVDQEATRQDALVNGG